MIGCTGHALAMGAVALLAADLRVGPLGDFKIGLNEVAIGLTLPTFATELARERLSPRHLQRAAVLAEVYDGPGAVEAGFLDLVAPADKVAGVAIEAATRLAELHLGAHHATKRRVRKAALAVLRKSLDEDLGNIGSLQAERAASRRRAKFIGLAAESLATRAVHYFAERVGS